MRGVRIKRQWDVATSKRAVAISDREEVGWQEEREQIEKMRSDRVNYI